MDSCIISIEPQIAQLSEIQGWIGKTIKRNKPIEFAADAACPLPVGSKVVVLNVTRTTMHVLLSRGHMDLPLKFWGDGGWALCEN